MKLLKAFTKFMLYIPFYLMVVFLYHLIYYRTVADWDIIIIPILLSLVTIYINIFDYGKFNNLPIKDYLESRHSFQTKYSEEAWSKCKNLNNHIFNFKLEVINYSKETLSYKVHFSILIGQLNSILHLKKVGDYIEVDVKKQFITFLPDRGTNFRLLKQLKTKLENNTPQ